MVPAAAPPLRSMTGYGRGAAAAPGVRAEVELRSVNGKGLHLKVRVPGERLDLEPALEEILRRSLVRGTVQGQVRTQVLDPRPAALQRPLLRRYLQEWRRAERELGLEARDPTLADLLALPGAVAAAEEEARVGRAVRRAVVAAAREALATLLTSREREGQRLRRELLGLVRRLEACRRRVERALPAARRAFEDRLRERVRSAWEAAGVQEPLDLARELVYLAERADVREELARLGIHLARLRSLLEGGGAVGRELEFLAQECQREVNTLGSKSADARLSREIVAMKLAVQQVKEQAANVE